jgi:hypothetical protein
MKFKIYYSRRLGTGLQSQGILIPAGEEKEFPDTGYFLDWVWLTYGLDSQVLLKPTPPNGMEAQIFSPKDVIATV